MKKLISNINKVRKSPTSKVIDNRIKEFESVKDKQIFSELCFCILTANSSAENCIRVQKEAGKHFYSAEREELASKLKNAGCRFHTKRAGYIFEARQQSQAIIENLRKMDEKEIRNWIADTVKGIGMKEASHFLRNIGKKNVAIIDFHIIDLLEKEGIISRPKKLDRKTYLEIEQILEEVGRRAGLNLAELDLYLWYLETGKVLK